MPNDKEHDQDLSSGVDLERIKYNLTLTVEERLEQHRRALENVLLLREAGRKLREQDSNS